MREKTEIITFAGGERERERKRMRKLDARRRVSANEG